tara:strand:- start:103 stop:336 length:234 start_codon:yes stop_codon:yes gene_type:complete
MNKIDDLERAMMAKFEKADEEEKLRNMSAAEKLQLQEEEEHAKMVESRFIQKFSPEWRKKNKKKKKIAKASRKRNRK